MFSQNFALGNAQKLQVAGDFPLPAVLLLPCLGGFVPLFFQ